jgi:SAM-dependent methyltransferase
MGHGPEGAPERPHIDGFPQGAFRQLAELEEENFWFRSRNRLILWALECYFPHARRLLEVGCGTGFVLKAIRERFPEMEIVGADQSDEALRIAGERSAVALVRADARDLPFESDFDVVCAFDVLEHIDEDVDVLCQMAEATRPGGGVLMTVPQYRWLWSAADEYGRHQRRYSKREIEAKVGHAGLTVARSTAWVCSLLPFVALSRLRNGHRRPFDPQAELRLPGLANRAFERVLDAEGRAIAAGVTLPFGSSRLVVAYRT